MAKIGFHNDTIKIYKGIGPTLTKLSYGPALAIRNPNNTDFGPTYCGLIDQQNGDIASYGTIYANGGIKPRSVPNLYLQIGTDTGKIIFRNYQKKQVGSLDNSGNLKLTGSGLQPARDLWHDEASVKVGNAITSNVDSSQRYNSLSAQNPAAQNDLFITGVVLIKGSYFFHTLGKSTSNSGIITWKLNDTTIDTQDWYSAGDTYNVVKSSAQINLTESSEYVLVGQITSKNALSTDYFANLTKYWFEYLVPYV